MDIPDCDDSAMKKNKHKKNGKRHSKIETK